MVILISGASHTGKTNLAQKLLEKYGYPYLSIDHLKMGLIRSGQTPLTPLDDDKLTSYLWPIVKEMIKTAIENEQNLIVEGCYIPYDWQNDFNKQYLSSIKYICLVMSESYISNHFEIIKSHASVIEHRLDDASLTPSALIKENLYALKMCKTHHLDYILIDDDYNIELPF
ncbi:MAG: AAA family ATPase [Oscillospiraceae bacterium]|nr:AAA family ATPase [Oscillospiraceae bacterium]